MLGTSSPHLRRFCKSACKWTRSSLPSIMHDVTLDGVMTTAATDMSYEVDSEMVPRRPNLLNVVDKIVLKDLTSG